MKIYIALIFNDISREGISGYHHIPLYRNIQYVGLDRNKADNAICEIIYGTYNNYRYEELKYEDNDYELSVHDYAFKYVPIDKEGNDIELSEGCYGYYYADIIEEYIDDKELNGMFNIN